jgi:hypothetical protein
LSRDHKPATMKTTDSTNPMEEAARMFAEGIAAHLVPILREQFAMMPTATAAPAQDVPQWMTVEAVAAMLSRSPYWVRERKAVLGGRKAGKYLYFDRAAVEAYIRDAGHITQNAA